jgi:Domain of unknown function (DUF4932)
MGQSAVRAQDAPPARNASNLTIEVNEGIELMSLVQYLGGHLCTATPSPYMDDIHRHFGAYRTHPAVMMMFDFRFPVYTDFVECGLMLNGFPDIKMRPIPDSCSWAKLAGRDTLTRYLRLCMQFYRDSHFHDFYAAHRAMFAQWEKGLRDSIAEPIRIFDSLINTRRDRHWMICMDPLNDWGAHTITPSNVNPMYSNYFIYQLGYFGQKDKNGYMLFATDLYNFAWHEGTHAFTDSILIRAELSIDSLSALLPKNPRLERQNIHDWGHYFNELIPRAVSLALTKQFRPEEEYTKLLKEEQDKGFVHVREVSDLIYSDFVHERRGSSFEVLLPEILALLRKEGTARAEKKG